MTYNYCPDCGGKCIRYSAKGFQCEICHKRWFDQPAAAADCIVVNDKEEILLTIRANEPKKGTLTIPGGFVDNNETAEQTVIREVLEESGAEIGYPTYFKSKPNTYIYRGHNYCCLTTTFLAKFSKFVKNFDTKETINILWIKPSNLNLQEIGLDNVRDVLRDYLELISAKRH